MSTISNADACEIFLTRIFLIFLIFSYSIYPLVCAQHGHVCLFDIICCGDHAVKRLNNEVILFFTRHYNRNHNSAIQVTKRIYGIPLTPLLTESMQSVGHIVFAALLLTMANDVEGNPRATRYDIIGSSQTTVIVVVVKNPATIETKCW